MSDTPDPSPDPSADKREETGPAKDRPHAAPPGDATLAKRAEDEAADLGDFA
ncbi:hypothetical protein NZL82_10615 [Sphingomonas sanguinis]|jgi:hypothetical protein|uniref:hypothetical protein n=1 Tax=Sphingomonas sp. LC-1 TaxID=3110957 RepID=UPI0021BAD98A|nr:hypothetical protein [Sphingomonas sp. LC-1]MCT8002331.1 hypothetical protein [Sphingomonas sp. LC-1]